MLLVGNIIKGLQKLMLRLIPTISERWKERIEDFGGIKYLQVLKFYLGHPRITENEIPLHENNSY